VTRPRPFRLLEQLHASRTAVLSYAAIALVVAQFEAVALILVVPTAQAVSAGSTVIEAAVGPFDLSLDVTRAMWLSFGCLVLAFVGNLFGSALRARYVASWERHLRDDLLAEFLAADWEVQRASRTGRLHTLSMQTTRASQALSASIVALRSMGSIAVFLAAALVVDWRAALGIAVVGAGLFALLRPANRRIKGLAKKTSITTIAYGEDLNEFAGQAREVRIFQAWPAIEGRLGVLSAEAESYKRRAGFLMQALQPAYQYVGLALVMGMLALAAQADGLDLTALGVTAVLLIRSLNYGQQLQLAVQQISDATPFVEQIQVERDRWAAATAAAGTTDIDAVDEIAFRRVGFAYDDDGTPALSEVDLTLRHGRVYGIVGPSGSGKSTLVSLLLRLRAPSLGRIEVNGVPAEDVSLVSWYRHVTFVPQEPSLFHGTVADNIAYLDPAVDRAAVERAAAAAGIDDVIRALPQGYDTPVGRASRDLSGGQVQRIGIARALARGAQVLVLDEPTSALDVHAEAVIAETLGALSGSVLVVVVAHRLSTLGICDELVVLEDGRVTAHGTPAEVLAANDFFRRAMELGSLDITR